MQRSALLPLACLVAITGTAQAQSSHLPSVSVKDFSTIQVNYIDDGSGTITKQWIEKRYGTSFSSAGETYLPATTKKETFVITDAEFTIYCSAASTTSPLFSPIINNDLGDQWLYPTRVRSTLSAPGRDSIHVSFTSGVVLPPGFTFSFPIMAAGNYTVQRAIFFGYYTK
jgi:hypothetical protein